MFALRRIFAIFSDPEALRNSARDLIAFLQSRRCLALRHRNNPVLERGIRHFLKFHISLLAAK